MEIYSILQNLKFNITSIDSLLICFCVSSHWLSSVPAMDKWRDDALVKHEHALKLNLSLISLLSLLEQPAGGFMIREERMNVESVEGQMERVDRILKVLRGKGNEEFDIFLKVLNNSGNDVWARTIEKSAQLFRKVQSGGVTDCSIGLPII